MDRFVYPGEQMNARVIRLGPYVLGDSQLSSTMGNKFGCQQLENFTFDTPIAASVPYAAFSAINGSGRCRSFCQCLSEGSERFDVYCHGWISRFTKSEMGVSSVKCSNFVKEGVRRGQLPAQEHVRASNAEILRGNCRNCMEQTV
jgi:hypothetical protein